MPLQLLRVVLRKVPLLLGGLVHDSELSAFHDSDPVFVRAGALDIEAARGWLDRVSLRGEHLTFTSAAMLKCLQM